MYFHVYNCPNDKHCLVLVSEKHRLNENVIYVPVNQHCLKIYQWIKISLSPGNFFNFFFSFLMPVSSSSKESRLLPHSKKTLLPSKCHWDTRSPAIPVMDDLQFLQKCWWTPPWEPTPHGWAAGAAWPCRHYSVCGNGLDELKKNYNGI